MAQLLLISDKSTATDGRSPGDIVEIREDWRKVTDTEKAIFDIVVVSEEKAVLELLMPRTFRAHRSKTTDWTLEPPEEKECFEDATGALKEIVERPRFVANYDKIGKQITNNYDTLNKDAAVLIAAPTAVEK